MEFSPFEYKNSSSPSSSPTLVFDRDMCTSKGSNGGCLSSLVRRILCSRSLPTHPSDQIQEVELLVECEKVEEFKGNEKMEAQVEVEVEAETAVTPAGIVARLMGLESMPDIKLTPIKLNPRAVSRSRSMNSLDRFRKCDQMFDLHKKVKSTLSFRDLPLSLSTLLEVENEKFLVLKFENGSETKEWRRKLRKSEKVFGELKQRRSERYLNKENVQAAESVYDEEKLRSKVLDKSSENVFHSGRLKDITNTMLDSKHFYESLEMVSQAETQLEPIVRSQKPKKKRKKRTYFTRKKIDPEFNSQVSSPVSVLDFDSLVPRLDESACSVRISSGRKLSPKLDFSQKLTSSSIDDNFMIDDRNKKAHERIKHCGWKKKGGHGKHYSDVWSEVCRFAGDELNDMGVWKQGDVESVSVDIGFEILDELLDGMVDELVNYIESKV